MGTVSFIGFEFGCSASENYGFCSGSYGSEITITVVSLGCVSFFMKSMTIEQFANRF